VAKTRESSGCLLLGVFVLLAGCDEPEPAPARPAAPAPSASASTPAAAAASAPARPAPRPAGCPAGSVRVAGGAFRVGTGSVSAAPEESPRFTTRVADFCMDVTEVTRGEYARCVAAGKCTAGRDDKRFCNARYDDRDDHPMNCVDWHQASAYCAWKGQRLPSEVEWEYAARGGAEYRLYSWGNDKPNGRTCWKHVGGTCPVKSFDAGAFGLYDLIGNVWEWTSSGFGPYPWPPAHAPTRVYRGGSWSRRFEKWMSPRLRNRFRPKEQGSHLGFRCAGSAPGATCAYGKAADGGCLFGVDSVECAAPEVWNGARCAKPGAARCPEGRVEKPGLGCVLEVEAEGPALERETTPVSRARSPEFDGDCGKYHPERPHAYRYAGGTHAGRNATSRAAGCINRDVGVGWNSTCCP
jgi:formylglycine-generating enzyme required for sulfatase activity